MCYYCIKAEATYFLTITITIIRLRNQSLYRGLWGSAKKPVCLSAWPACNNMQVQKSIDRQVWWLHVYCCLIYKLSVRFFLIIMAAIILHRSHTAAKPERLQQNWDSHLLIQSSCSNSSVAFVIYINSEQQQSWHQSHFPRFYAHHCLQAPSSFLCPPLSRLANILMPLHPSSLSKPH